MRALQLSFATLREAPADAVSVHERLLRRAGFMRKAEAGVYVFLPLGARVLRRMAQVLEQECEAKGFQPVITPLAEPLQAVVESARSQVRSWRALPVKWYTMSRIRYEHSEPRGGLLEAREAINLQLWCFDADTPSAMENVALMREALVRACWQMGIDTLAGDCDGWALLAMVEHGEDSLLQCASCGSAAAPEWYPLSSESIAASCSEVPPAQIVSTPNLRTVGEVAAFLNVPPSRLVKTLLLVVDGKAVAALVRGDHELSVLKVRRALGATAVQLMSAERVEAISRAPVGYAGPVSLEGIPLIADWAVRPMQDFVVGANLADAHRVHVCWGRDFAEPVWADLRTASPGERCGRCGGELVLRQGIFVGKVQLWQSEHGLVYDDAQGVQQPVQATVGELNLTRTLAALVESSHDNDGLVWHPSVAPFEAVILLLNPFEQDQRNVAESLYLSLRERGIDTLLDDRDQRAGMKFKDADLIGIPVQVVIGRSASEKLVEVRLRRDRQPHRVALEDAAIAVEELLLRQKEVVS
ncbi:MAG: His/Gly/Thr/Pro-type tRNA ligase C-terminal domain-containing protein [bacterium]|nr:His/Gly/Thr/Pro-type tRNA ligase C-terminal domain-containing protein [bacterium]